MERLERRSLLKLMLGVGAAAACGLSVPGTAEAGTPAAPTNAGPVPETVEPTAGATQEGVESQLEPNQFYFYRRRRFYRRRFFYRPRRRFIRFYRIRRYRYY